jgi:hypothetical protein
MRMTGSWSLLNVDELLLEALAVICSFDLSNPLELGSFGPASCILIIPWEESAGLDLFALIPFQLADMYDLLRLT